MTTNTPILRSAMALLAEAVGCPVESDTEIDLRDKERVWIDRAVAAIEQAQREAIEAAAFVAKTLHITTQWCEGHPQAGRDPSPLETAHHILALLPTQTQGDGR